MWLGVYILASYLHSGLRQVDFEGHLLPHEDVWVACLGEECFQDVQLGPCKSGAFPTLLTRGGWAGVRNKNTLI